MSAFDDNGGSGAHLTSFYARNATLGESPRAQRLSFRESFFRCLEYEGRSNDFMGRALNVEGSPQRPLGLPPGYADHAERDADSVPFEVRRPTTPSRLARTIVQRFTGLLFSSQKRPTVRVAGDPDTNDWIEGVIQAGDFWQVMSEARNTGGAMGTAVVSFGFRDGKPSFELHNPKHCFPTWKDRGSLDLEALDITYQYPVEVRTRKGWATRLFWYRRRIDQEFDVTFNRIPVGPGVVPGSAEYPWTPARWARHGFGECPAVWIQNTRDSSGIDGDPDCEGQFEAIQEHDIERSLAGEGIKPNCDPTVHVATSLEVAKIKKGSRNAIVTELGGSASYMEMSGQGSVVARENANALKSQILEAVSCVIESENASATTATEIRHRYRAMFDRADLMRSQYGNGIKRLLERVERAARKLGTKAPPAEGEPEIGSPGVLSIDRIDASGRPKAPPLPTEDEGNDDEDIGERPVVYTITLPPKIVESADDPDTPALIVPRKLGPGGGTFQILWPDHVKPTPAEVETWVRALTAAEAAGYIDAETASQILAAQLGLQDATTVFKKAQAAKGAKEAESLERLSMQLAAQQAAPPFGQPPGRPETEEGSDPDDLSESER